MIDTSWHEGLRNVPGFSLPVLSSAGLESRASSIAERVVKAHRFLSKTLEFTPPSALLVLSFADWPSRSGTQVYGMPHFDEVPCSEMRHPVHLGPRSTGPVCDREYQ